MTNESAQLIFTLSESVPFRTALYEFIDAEVKSRVDHLRGSLRGNNVPEALMTEGEIKLLQDLPALLDGYARKYSSS